MSEKEIVTIKKRINKLKNYLAIRRWIQKNTYPNIYTIDESLEMSRRPLHSALKSKSTSEDHKKYLSLTKQIYYEQKKLRKLMYEDWVAQMEEGKEEEEV